MNHAMEKRAKPQHWKESAILLNNVPTKAALKARLAPVDLAFAVYVIYLAIFRLNF